MVTDTLSKPILAREQSWALHPNESFRTIVHMKRSDPRQTNAMEQHRLSTFKRPSTHPTSALSIASWVVLCGGIFLFWQVWMAARAPEVSEVEYAHESVEEYRLPPLGETDAVFKQRFQSLGAEDLGIQLDQSIQVAQTLHDLILEDLVAAGNGQQALVFVGQEDPIFVRPDQPGAWLTRVRSRQDGAREFLAALAPAEESKQLAWIDREVRWLRKQCGIYGQHVT